MIGSWVTWQVDGVKEWGQVIGRSRRGLLIVTTGLDETRTRAISERTQSLAEL